MEKQYLEEYEGFKIGDLITTFYSGYYILDKIERRFYTEKDIEIFKGRNITVGGEHTPLFYFHSVADEDADLVKPNNNKNNSPYYFCGLASVEIPKEIQKLEERKMKFEKLMKLYEKNM